jgi:hypothetical protein
LADTIAFQIPLEIRIPRPETVVVVTKSHWERLESRIEGIRQTDTKLHTFMGIFAGLTGSAFFYFLSLSDTNHKWPMPLIGLGALGFTLISLLATILCYCAIGYLKGNTDSTNSDILAEMRVLGQRYYDLSKEIEIAPSEQQ